MKQTNPHKETRHVAAVILKHYRNSICLEKWKGDHNEGILIKDETKKSIAYVNMNREYSKAIMINTVLSMTMHPFLSKPLEHIFTVVNANNKIKQQLISEGYKL